MTSPPSSPREDDPQWLPFHGSALVRVGTWASCLRTSGPVTIMLKHLSKVVPTPARAAWHQVQSKSEGGSSLVALWGLGCPAQGGGPSYSWGSQSRHPSLAGPGVSTQYCYDSVSTGQITALPVKKMHVLLSPLEPHAPPHHREPPTGSPSTVLQPPFSMNV